MEEARDLISTWRVHPGVTLLSLNGTEFALDRPIEIRTEAIATRADNGGALITVEEGMKYADAHPIPDPVPKVGKPPQPVPPEAWKNYSADADT